MKILNQDVADLPEGWLPVNLVLIVECIDTTSPDFGPSATRLSTRASDGLQLWGAMGMLKAAAADLDQQYTDQLVENQDD